MNQERNISLWLNINELEEDIKAYRQEFCQALGYLTSYNMTNAHLCDSADISQQDSGKELIATYNGKFTIGAIWRPNDRKYSYHS